ncbi:hypothetical protein C5S31_09060 [ANME-1 cluster archaeon GoMg2]|nr:hypothetical protein [ANME-1 cluster archaeon GoMg2]
MKEGECKSRREKVVIGIILAVIMVFSVVVSMASVLPLSDSSCNGLYNDIIRKVTGNASETNTVDITGKKVIFDMPSTVVIGERLTIKGTANTGDTVTIAVDDEVVQKLYQIVITENGEFEEEIDTSSEEAPPGFLIPGSVRLKAYIDYDKGTGTVPEKDDGSTVILMLSGDLTAELSTNIVAPSDEFTISGTAKGSKYVDILIVAPYGYCGTNIEDSSVKMMYIGSTSVTTSDGTFYKEIIVDDNVDTGHYLVMVLSKGANEYYGSGKPWITIEDALNDYSLNTRTQDEMLEIILDIMSLSDDLLWIDLIKIKSSVVVLDPVADVGIGEPLVVTGTSTREEGYLIVVTVKGPMELTPQIVKVENGAFKAIIDTSNAKVGTYIVQADDVDGQTDATTVEILPAKIIFDTGPGTYPSISGTHKGTIKPKQTITVQALHVFM